MPELEKLRILMEPLRENGEEKKEKPKKINSIKKRFA
jgi:hypothetical protein